MTEKCIGECIKPNEKTIHPLTLEIMGNLKQDVSICPSEPYIMYSRKGNYTKDRENIICNKNNSIIPNEIDNMIYNPEIRFNVKSFLELYNITSFDAGLLWIKINKNIKSFQTIYRILDALWNGYYNKIKKISSELIECYKSISERLLEDQPKVYKKLINSKNTDKIIKKSIKKILKNNQKWNDFDYDVNNQIKNNIIKYTN